MAFHTMVLAQLFNGQPNETMRLLLIIGGGLLLFVVWIGVFLVPVLIWRRSVRRCGYPGLRAYLANCLTLRRRKWMPLT